MGEMTSGTGEVYSDDEKEEPVMTTGTGEVLSGPDQGKVMETAGAEDPAAEDSGETKAELYEKAQAADIEGRSSMSKEELKEALDEQ